MLNRMLPYTYAENLMQAHVGPVLAATVSVSSHDPCSIGLESLILLVSSIPPDSQSLSAYSSVGFSEL